MAPRSTNTEMLRRLVELPGRRVVDVGCGSGELVRWLRNEGANVVGVECGAVMLRLAHEADPDHRDAYLEGVGQALPLPSGEADVVVMSFSLHHVPEAEMGNALREAQRVLRPGGALYVAEPIAEGPGHEVVRIIDDETEVRRLAQNALLEAPTIGFELIDDSVFTSRTTLQSAEAFAQRIVGVDPSRAERMRANYDEFVETFHRLAQPVDGMYVFDQDTRVKLFRKVAD